MEKMMVKPTTASEKRHYITHQTGKHSLHRPMKYIEYLINFSQFSESSTIYLLSFRATAIISSDRQHGNTHCIEPLGCKVMKKYSIDIAK